MHILQKDHVQTEESAAASSSTGDGDESVPPTIRRTNHLRKPPSRAPAASRQTDSSTGDADADSSTADEVNLDTRLLQSEDVRLLEARSDYQSLKLMTHKKRKQANTQKKFVKMRSAIRASAKAAREAYILAKEAQPDTPDVREMLQVLVSGNIDRYFYQVFLPGTLVRYFWQVFVSGIFTGF